MIGDSFAPETFKGQLVLSIQKDALEREFLLTTSLIEQEPVPMFSGLKTRIIVFRYREGAVHMLDVSNSKGAYTDQYLLLASFDVVSESIKSYSFDFGQGMTKVYIAGDWYAPDFAGTGYNPSALQEAFELRDGYIDSIELVDDTHVAVRHIAHMVIEGLGIGIYPTVEMRYAISAYNPDSSYQPLDAPSNMDRYGFFTANPLYRPNAPRTDIHVARFHPDQPIYFSISANTPAEYRDAVRDGILYWNQALGDDVIEVADAPEGVSAPHVQHNMVQWVPWDSSGFAYADAQLDPRSGRVLHANVYMTSAFVASTREAARRQLAQIEARLDSPRGSGSRVPQWQHAERCIYGVGQNALEAEREALMHILAEAVDDESVLRASRDYVRLVVAHEIGHSLGLRHNFAGSLTMNYPVEERSAMYASYLGGAELSSDAIGTDSVMDYSRRLESFLMGSRMRRGLAAGSYDRVAMQILFRAATPSREKIPLFCTDSHIGVYADCMRFDAGNSPAGEALSQGQTALEQLAVAIAEQFIVGRAYYRQAVDEVELDAYAMAFDFVKWRRNGLDLLLGGKEILAVERTFPRLDSTNQSEVAAAHGAYVIDAYDAVAGFSGILSSIPVTLVDTLVAEFAGYISRPDVRENAIYGVQYEFSAGEIADMTARVAEFAHLLEQALIETEMELLSNDGLFFPHSPVSDQLAVALGRRQRDILLATDGTTEVDVIVDPAAPAVTIDLPVHQYSSAARYMAATLLFSDRAASNTWAEIERSQSEFELVDLIETSTPVDLLSVDPADQIDPILIAWLTENLQILGMLAL